VAAITWETLFGSAKRRYGLAARIEDGLLTDQLFLDRVNELLRELALVAPFREEFTVNLPTTAILSLDTRIISIVDQTVRADYSGSGNYELELDYCAEQTLRRLDGVLENVPAGTPAYWYTLRGSAGDASLRMAIHPRSDQAVTNGLKFSARVVPAAITAADSKIPVQDAELPYLIPGICVCLGEVELSREVVAADRKIALWERRWKESQTAFADAIEDSLRTGRRRIHYLPDIEDY
jgi:hypothetical protein